jgi:hypothetical protein
MSSSTQSSGKSPDDDLIEMLASFYDDPLGFVLFAFPWGERILQDQQPRQWQCDTLNRIGAEVAGRGFNGKDPVDPIQMATASGHGIGKAQCVDMEIDTPDGKRRWGDLLPGDSVFGADGKPTRVIATRRFAGRPCYRVTFNDGSSTIADEGHVWRVFERQGRRNKEQKYRELTTGEILKRGLKQSNGKSNPVYKWEIPDHGAVEYGEKKFDVHPYLFGVWLGDGVKDRPCINTADQEIFDNIEKLGYVVGRAESENRNGNSKAATRRIHGFRDRPFSDCTTYTAKIPDEYKYSSAEQRLSLLRGLLDADGHVRDAGSAVLTSVSEGLIDDAIWIARSIGLWAKKQKPSQAGYRNSNGDYIKCCDAHKAHILDTKGLGLFGITRKQEKVNNNPRKQTAKRKITSISFYGYEDGQCIEVENPDGLYLTNDFIVTHNSAIVAWIILWIMSTRPHAKGVVTANTNSQLNSKTWSELQKWHKMCITRDWFECHASKGNLVLYHVEHPSTWRVDGLTCREENSESFAGLHAAGSTPFYIFDESSAISDKIFEVAQGGLTDGEPMFFLFGNPTRRTGFFFETFHRLKHRWITQQIDSRDVEGTNNALFDEWVQDYGEDSDLVKVRVRGMFPSASEMQFIPSAAVDRAMQIEAGNFAMDDPIIMGVDIARGGDDSNIIYFRRGMDAKYYPRIEIPGEKTSDTTYMVSIITEAASNHNPAAIFIDATGVGGPVADRLRQLGFHAIDVQFGMRSPNGKYADMATYMWQKMKEAIVSGGMALPNEGEVEQDLTGREYVHNQRDQLKLEAKADMKKRGLASPDIADALALTFAQPVAPRPGGGYTEPKGELEHDYDPFEEF